ncbi:HD domain-containing phosphohydrolase [Marispirochaeta aestuarii]|uniref:HD-GYP domain-containing protein n=1 Tax=Marispirochaeta aestuarii TaxID=1963862 RepID=UPI0029C7AE63|nr:HD domain-containing phosphohydrolase [Marispirochaeta aestuarii]
MNKVGLDNLEVNSYIDAPVFLDDAYIILSPDIPVSQELLTRLSSWHYTQVYTDGQPAEKPRNTGENAEESRLGFLKEDVHESAERQEVSSFYQQKVEEVRSIYSRFAEREELRIDEVTDIIKDIISTLKSSRRFLLSVPFISQPEEDYLASSCLKTAILSLAVGEFLKLPPHRLIEVGSAGLLHKIGMMKIPRNIYMSDRPLSPNERKTIYAHPIIGFKILKAAAFPATVALAVLEHAEHVDGTGYPRKLTSDKISLYGKIVAVATAYNGAVSRRPYKKERDGHSGIMDLLKDIGKHFDERILRALVYTLSIYPIGTYVELTNGAKGVVVRTNINDPKYPAIKLLLNEKGNLYAEAPILQTKEGDPIQIARSLPPDAVRELEERLG